MAHQPEPHRARAAAHQAVAPALAELSSPRSVEGSEPALTKKQLQAECRATLSFLHRAHLHSVDVARRLGVHEALLSKLIPQSPVDVRIAALREIRETLIGRSIGHTGSFPDFIGMADSVSRYYKDERRKQAGFYPPERHSPFAFGSPVNTLNTCAEMLFVALSITTSLEQRGACLVLLNLLVSQTRTAIPKVSNSVSTALTESLAFEANRPRTQR